MARLVVFAVFCLLCIQTGHGSTCPERCTCTIETETITCNRGYFRALGSFLRAITPTSKTIFINDGNFPDVPAELQGFTRLKYLTLAHCKIGAIHPVAFAGLVDLAEIRVPNNLIDDLDRALFRDQKKLQVLDLSHNSLRILPEGVFDALESVEILNLRHNKLEQLQPEVFQKLGKLEYLDISYNRLYYIHPVTFTHLSSLQSLQMSSNFITFLQRSTFQNTSSLKTVFMQDNPWDCTCGISWLVQELSSNQTKGLYQNIEKMKCRTPLRLKSRTLQSVPVKELVCTEPSVSFASASNEYYLMHDIILRCNITGYPQPYIYWKTPHGHVLSHEDHHKYIGPDILEFKPAHHIFHTMLKYGAVSTPLEDGSLQITQIRQYFAGEYTCVGVNPLGAVTAGMNVTVVSAMQGIYYMSLIISFASAFLSMIIAIVVGLMRMCVESILRRRRVHQKKEIVTVMETTPSLSSESFDGDSLPKTPSPKFFHQLHFWSPYGSPMKCDTPPNSDPEWDRNDGTDPANLKETLEEVRARLREGVERNVQRVRHKAQYLRESSSVYMQTIRESASQSMQTIRDSSHEYATRVRHGVQLGVEQVKYHVQSMKELCGTGDLGQTISAISISTDVDSQERTAMIKQTTFV